MKILCYGDSNTYGYDPRSCFGDRYGAEDRWVDLLARKLNCTAINEGENGRQIPRREWEIHCLKQLLDREKDTDLLLIMLGTNDLLQGTTVEGICGRMEAFLKELDFDRTRTVLVAPPPVVRGQWVESQALTDASRELIRGYKALSAGLGVTFADTEAWNIPMTFDGVHFTEEGHRAFAEALIPILNKGE